MTADIRTREEVIAFRKDVRDGLAFSSFSVTEQEEILIALTELGTNIVRHSEGGSMKVTFPGEGDGRVALEARNVRTSGRGPHDGRGLGEGLSAVERLMENVRVEATAAEFLVTCDRTPGKRRAHGS